MDSRQHHSVRSIDPDDYQHLAVAVAAMRKRFGDRNSTPPHSHRRHQLIYAASGTMRIRTAAHTWIVPPARALFMPAGIEHRVTAFGNVDMCTLYLEPAVIETPQVRPRVIAVSALLRELIIALLDEPADYIQRRRGELLASLILDEISRGEQVAMGIPMPTDKRLLRLCNDILETPADDRNIDQLAETAGASARTLTRLFRQQLGMSLSAWRQQVRFHYALEAIARGDPIGRIARECGYRSASAFSAAFRKSFGQAPSQMAPSASRGTIS